MPKQARVSAAADRRAAFRHAEARLKKAAKVVVAAPASRSWYSDQALVVELLAWLEHYSIVPVIIAAPPFRYAAVCAAGVAKASAVILAVEDTEAALHAETADLFVALVARASRDYRSASPYVAIAEERGVPVLALFADGSATYQVSEDC
jgi:hypothetical protein